MILITYYTIMENLRINEKIKQNLFTGAKWLKILAVLTSVFMFFCFLMAIVSCFIPDNGSGISGIALAFIYLFLIMLYIYPLKNLD